MPFRQGASFETIILVQEGVFKVRWYCMWGQRPQIINHPAVSRILIHSGLGEKSFLDLLSYSYMLGRGPLQTSFFLYITSLLLYYAKKIKIHYRERERARKFHWLPPGGIVSLKHHGALFWCLMETNYTLYCFFRLTNHHSDIFCLLELG